MKRIKKMTNKKLARKLAEEEQYAYFEWTIR